MKAVVLRAFGGPAAMTLTEWPDPTPAAGEALIRVRTVSANRIDLDVSHGKGPGPVTLPLIQGIDPAGDLIAIGAGAVSGTLVPGTRVIVKPNIACGACEFCGRGEDNACTRRMNVGVHRPGGFAELVSVPSKNVFPIPSTLSYAEASALAHSFPVVLSMLTGPLAVTPSDAVLITGAAGSIGSAAIQVARHLGARVIAAVGSREKAETAEAAGAHAVIDYGAGGSWADQARRAAGAGGVTVLVQTSANGDLWREATHALARRGRIVVCGSHGGEVVPLDLRWLFRQRVTIVGAAGATYAAFRTALDLAALGAIRPTVDRVLPLASVREAFGVLETRRNRGKVVLDVTD